jgi:hypothetical protein
MVDTPKDAVPRTINFDYVKGNNFRVLHADGAYLAGSSTGLTLSFYSERQPIPRRVVHELGSNYEVGKELSEQKVVRDAIIRDVDVTFALSLETAKSLVKALGEVIQRIEEAKERTVRGPK